MGQEVSLQQFTQQDYQRFTQVLHQQLDELKQVMNTPSFGREALSIGAELELYLVDRNYQPCPVNIKLLESLKDDQFQTELNQYNLELNLNPVKAEGKPFSALNQEILDNYIQLSQCAEQFDAMPIATGILPTLQQQHMSSEFMTDTGRYHLLAKSLKNLRGEPFHICIDGDEQPIDFYTGDIGAEGANTSFQVHLMTPPEQFVDTFNGALLTLPASIGIAANSGVFLNRCVWDETRIALFKQSIDDRTNNGYDWRAPPRVTFGNGWLRKSGWELYAQAVNLYEPIMPVFFSQDDEQYPPKLAELNFHMGTTWPWCRAIYSHHNKGHMRIEFRALPSGPTAVDMVANAAFSIGMAVGIQENIEDYLSKLPFKYARYNFYRAAKNGLDATILWPQNRQSKLVEVPLAKVIEQLLPIADKGLSRLNVDLLERDKYLNFIEQRLAGGETGGSWSKKTLMTLRKTYNDDEACKRLVALYYENQIEGLPVSQWKQYWR